MLPGPIKSGKDGTRQYEIGEPVRISSGSSSGRYSRYGDALKAAAGYKQKARAEAEAKKDVDDDDDEKNTQGFKISPDAFVIEGYRDPGYTIAGQPGRSFLGPVGAAVGIFNPALGRGISAAGSLTGL